MKNQELIPQEELDAIAQYDAGLKQIAKSLLEVSKNMGALSGGRPSSLKELQGLSERVSAAEKELSRLSKERVVVEAQKTEAIKRSVVGIRELTKEEATARVAAQAHNREMKLEAEAARYAEGSLAKMQVTLRQMNDARRLLVQGSPEELAMVKDINELESKVSAAEQVVGNFRRNVGNYASGFSAISSNITMLVNELPNLAQSPRIFFQAISNNLPQLTLAIKAEREKIDAEIAKTGKATTSITKQVLGAMISWQTIIVVAISLLTKYGDGIFKWVGSLFSAEKRLDAVAARQKTLNELQGEAVKSAGDEITKLELLYSASQDASRSMEERTAAVDELQRLYPDYLGNMSNEAILAGNAAGAYKNLKNSIIEVAIAKASADKIAENELKRAEELQKLQENPEGAGFWATFAASGLYRGGSPERADNLLAERSAERTATAIDKVNKKYDEQRKIYEDLIDVRKLIDDDGGNTAHRTRMSNLNAERKAAEDLSVSEIDEHIGVINRTLAADKSSIAERISLTNDLYDLQEQRIRQLAKTQEDNLVQQNIDENTTYKKDGSVDSTIDEVTARGNVANQIKALQMVTDQALIDSDNDRINEINALEDEGIQYRIRALQAEFQKRANLIDQDESDELAALSTRYAKGEMTQQEYEDARLATTRKYAILRQNTELGMMQAVLAEMRSDTNLTEAQLQEIANYEQSIADLRVQINKDANDQKTKDNEKAAADAKKLEEAQRDFSQKMASEMLDFVGTLVQAATDRRLAALEEQLEAAQAYADEEQERIERLAEAGAISEEQKNARIALSEQQLKEREDDIENQKRDAQVRQAKYEKAQAIIQSQIATALSISTSAQIGFPAAIPFIAMAAALGAIQLATIMATPIPQYARGTEDHRGGLAWVGDGGRSEMVIMGGKAYKSPAVPTLIDLPKGAEVLPDYNQAVRDFAIANALTPIRQSDVPSGRGSAPYNDTMVLARLGDANSRLHKVTELISLTNKAINRQGSDRRFKEFRTHSKSIV